MKVLIISFDKNLVNGLKEALKDYTVMEARNGEEAINTISSLVDVVIYDAVAGSISEEEINDLYRQKFKDAKYVVLVDDIFPVDMDNIVAPNKVKLMRERAVEKIREAIAAPPGEVTIGEEDLSILKGIMPTEEPELSLEKLFFETETAESLPPPEPDLQEVLPKLESVVNPGGKKRLLLVSFDNNLVDRVKEVFSEKTEFIQARNMREVNDKAREADIIVFDTIMGMLARKTLLEMAKDELLSQKPYVLLIDELFTIETEDIPLQKKYSFAREAELDKAIQKVKELVEETAPAVREEVVEVSPQQEVGVMELLENILNKKQEEFTATESLPAQVEAPAPPTEVPIQAKAVPEDLANVLKDTVKNQLSPQNLLDLLSQVIRPEELKEYIAQKVEERIKDLLREQFQEVLSTVDVAQILREEAYRVLKERLREIVT